VPDKIDPALLASAADNLPFGWEFTVPHLEQLPGAGVLVMGGCGSIALYATMLAVAAGASRVEYRDIDPARQAITERFGASAVEGPPPRGAGEFPIVIDASANRDSLLCALRSAVPEGIAPFAEAPAVLAGGMLEPVLTRPRIALARRAQGS
jgi:alcohol dehydrogenase